MSSQDDKEVSIVSSACRLPLGVTSPSELWDKFCSPEFTGPEELTGPEVSTVESVSPDANFFNISPTEADSVAIRPIERLALELTWEALERAGIPPVSLRGKHVAVSFGLGDDDRWKTDCRFEHQRNANFNPSLCGGVSSFFDFHGPCSIVSTGCSSGAYAIRDGIQAILSGDCELAIVGAFEAFSGCSPSAGGVVFVLKRRDIAQVDGNPILGVFRSLVTGHQGATRARAVSNCAAHVALTRRSLLAAGILSSDIRILEMHGSQTHLGDTLESGFFGNVYDHDDFRDGALWVSSSRTVFRHCQATSTLVGILKVLACFQHKAIPPHHDKVLENFQKGDIQFPTTMVPLGSERPFIAQVFSLGFTGSIASIIIQEPLPLPTTIRDLPIVTPTSSSKFYVLPFSAKTTAALNCQIAEVYEWACETGCSLYDLGTILSICREHHSTRLSIDVSDIHALQGLSVGSSSPVHQKSGSTETLNEKIRLRYNAGHNVDFAEIYDIKNVPLLCQYLQTFPTYSFDRKPSWSVQWSTGSSKPTETSDETKDVRRELGRVPQAPSTKLIAETIASILNIPLHDIPYNKNIFDLGIDSLNSLELASTLSQMLTVDVSAMELYSLLTVENIYNIALERSQMHSSASIIAQFTQKDVDAWVTKYGGPIDTVSSPVIKRERVSTSITVLLTGANGMLGCSHLHELLSRPNVAKVFCLVRGDAWARLSSAYTNHGFDSSYLLKERELGRLVVIPTTDLGDIFLGCGQAAHSQLSLEVDTVVHLAWRLDFNLSVPGFEQCIEGARNLARFSAGAEKRVEYFFISSFSAYFRYDGILVPELPLSANKEGSLDQGYAISKLIAEHALFSLVRNSKNPFDLRVVRIGQICGKSLSGYRISSDMVPMMIESLPHLKSFLRNMPDVSWIPVDVCAAGLADFVFPYSRKSTEPDVATSLDNIEILHLANPRITPWPEVVNEISKLMGLDRIALVSLQDYVEAINSSPPQSVVPIRRLLPYFMDTLQKGLGDLPSSFSSLEVKKSVTLSPALASCPEIDVEFLRQMVAGFIETALTKAPTVIHSPPVLLFGPWSESSASPGVHMGKGILKAVEAKASIVRKAIGFTSKDLPLEHQLQTLINQISAYETFKKHSGPPSAVLGYCFGEYAAAVCAGLLSLDSAVDLIVRRAEGLASHGIEGSMLNVFADIKTVKRQLLKMPFRVDIAIHAGPKHFVLSGESAQIAAVQRCFQMDKRKDGANVKTKLVKTSLPFHSSLMDPVIDTLSQTLVNSQSASSSSDFAYVSGLIGKPISGSNLGTKYWLRHMRDPVLFLDAVGYIEKHFQWVPLVDMGPGRTVASIISRYSWEGGRLFGLDEFLS